MKLQQMKGLLLALVVSTSLVAKKDKDSVLDDINQRTAYIAKTVTQIEEMQKCSTVIMQSDVGTSGYVISSPGQYCLGEDIVFAPENPATFTPITITDSTGSGAEGFAAVSGGVLRGIFVVSGGSNYSANPTITIGGSGSGAAATATVSGGSIVNFNITSGGSGYKDTVQAAITITCGNVNLQMKNCTLSQAGGVDASTIPAYSGVNNPSSQVPFVVGILVPDIIPTNPDVNAVGIESVYISGDQAIIDGFSMWGVYCQGHVADVQLSNMTVKNCGLLASYYLRPFPTYYPNGLPAGVYPQPGTVLMSVGGINIGETDIYGFGPYFFMQNFGVPQNRVNTCSIDTITSLNNYFIGINGANTTDMYMANSHFDSTFCDDPNVGVVGGAFGLAAVNYEDPSVLNMTVENCTFNNTTFAGDLTTEVQPFALQGALAAFMSRCYNVAFNNCNFDHTSTTFATDELQAKTAAFFGSSFVDCSWKNCTFSDVSSLAYVAGFFINEDNFVGDPTQSQSPRNLVIQNCVASNIQQNGQNQLPNPVIALEGGQGYGFYVHAPKNVLLENCVASDLIMNGPASPAAYVTGFYLTDGQEANPDFETDNIIYRNCTAQRSMTMQGGGGLGFMLIPNLGPQNTARSVTYQDCIAQGCFSSIPTMTAQFPGLTQSIAGGFVIGSILETDPSYPVTYISCKALHNKGYPSLTTGILQGTNYSAGFFESGGNPDIPVQKHSYYNCEAIDNVYGFIFNNARQNVVRNCRADLNVATTTGTSADGVVGEGFTDLGLQSLVVTSTVSANLVAPTPSVFGIGTIGTSPIAGEYTGDNITFPDPNSSNFGFVGQISAYSGSPDYKVTLVLPLPNAPANGDPVAIYAHGTPAAPLQSFSLFQSNNAFENGAGSKHFGENGNYNVKYGVAATDYVPTLTGNLTTPNALGGSYFPEASYIAHNLSITHS